MVKTIFAVLFLGLIATGCKNADMAQFASMGSKHKVELYSGGQKIGEWTANGNVSNESQSDGFYFQDEATGKLIEISGTVIITQL